MRMTISGNQDLFLKKAFTEPFVQALSWNCGNILEDYHVDNQRRGANKGKVLPFPWGKDK